MMMTHESHGCEFDTSCVPLEFLIILSYHFSNNLINKQTNGWYVFCMRKRVKFQFYWGEKWKKYMKKFYKVNLESIW